MLQDEISKLRKDLKETFEQKQKMQDEIEGNNDYILQMEEKVYKSF